jgi:Protein of unknown function (DUF3096)
MNFAFAPLTSAFVKERPPGEPYAFVGRKAELGCCVTSAAVHDAVNQALHPTNSRRFGMDLNIGHITPIIALIAGILILIMPRLLNYIVAFYLIVVGLVGLNGIYHFMR